jgi:hypothetical protein
MYRLHCWLWIDSKIERPAIKSYGWTSERQGSQKGFCEEDATASLSLVLEGDDDLCQMGQTCEPLS